MEQYREAASLNRGLSLEKTLEFVHICNVSKCEIFVRNAEKTVNGKGVLGLVSFMQTVKEGESVVLFAKGADADLLLENLLDILLPDRRMAI